MAVYNIFRDHLGTITHLKTGGTVTEYNFDSWGRRRSANDWSYTMDANDIALFADRGFTGHEYLEDFKLYNMNGRLYDPVVARFLSPDPYIQSPGFTQNLNRYSYFLNNPLKYIDPTGNKTWFGNFFDWVNKGVDNLGKWWSKNNLPRVGVNVSGNGVVPYAGVQGPGNTTISIGYNLDTRLIGIGNNADGFTNFYYPGKNYDVAAQNAAAEVARVRTQDGAEWRAASNGGGGGELLYLIDKTNTLAGVAGTAVDATKVLLTNTKIGSDLAYDIAYISPLAKSVNSLKPISYGLSGFTIGADVLLSSFNNPLTGKPYQSWGETGANTIVTGTSFVIGGWYGVLIQLDYMAAKAYITTSREHPEWVLSYPRGYYR